MMSEADKTGASWLVAQALQGYEPAPADARGGFLLRTTDAIVAMLADMYELETNDVAEAMLALGYRMIYEPSGRHGWAMRPRQ